jgi:large subunit ribosomal protein L30
MKKVHVTLVKSIIDRPERQKNTVRALGLKRINHTVVHDESPQIKGMIDKVIHLVKVDYK